MLILLPPSETKRDGGGEGSSIDPGSLSFPELAVARRTVSVELRKLACNLTSMAEALRLGPNQRHELIRNRTVRASLTMPALDRYTGVLYDALDPGSLPTKAREFAAQTVAVHSALFGLVGAGDLIPAYRLSHDSRLPTVSLKKAWREPIAAVLAKREGLLLDLRSEAYAALGPVPQREGSYFLRLVARGSDARVRALNHFNKKGKGEFVRAMLLAGIDHPDASSLIAWANRSGWALRHGATGELELEVVNSLA